MPYENYLRECKRCGTIFKAERKKSSICKKCNKGYWRSSVVPGTQMNEHYNNNKK